MTFPRFQLRTNEGVPIEVLNRRLAFALGPLASRIGGSPANYGSSEKIASMAEAFGRDMFARCGKDWPAMIGLATGAAMQAERDAMGEVK